MSSYSAEQLANFRIRLNEHLESLRSLQDTADDAAKTVTLDQSKVGRLSRMDALQGQAMAVASVARREVELKDTARAIKRIDDNVFGECIECLEEIDPRRIEHNPAASLCLRCAAAAEQNP